MRQRGMKSFLWTAAGWFSLVIGIIGLGVPLVWPTTPFVLLSCYCFSRGSERWHQYLLNHHYFGETVRLWQEKRAISRRAKRFATLTMLAPFPITIYVLGLERWWLSLGIALVFALVLRYVWSFPDE
ncbi:MAG: YbaN family protein [Cardiobacteriaceae bacterium]|nr:YbaN family protein [Cardiobacteriaceae bacterium]